MKQTNKLKTEYNPPAPLRVRKEVYSVFLLPGYNYKFSCLKTANVFKADVQRRLKSAVIEANNIFAQYLTFSRDLFFYEIDPGPTKFINETIVNLIDNFEKTQSAPLVYLGNTVIIKSFVNLINELCAGLACMEKLFFKRRLYHQQHICRAHLQNLEIIKSNFFAPKAWPG